MASKRRTNRVAPRKINVLLCQAAAAAGVLLNVCRASVAKFAVQQKCA